METKQHDDILSLIARNLAGLADLNETAKLKAWIGFSEFNKQYFEQVKKYMGCI